MARRAAKLNEDASFPSPAQNRERQRADAFGAVTCRVRLRGVAMPTEARRSRSACPESQTCFYARDPIESSLVGSDLWME